MVRRVPYKLLHAPPGPWGQWDRWATGINEAAEALAIAGPAALAALDAIDLVLALRRSSPASRAGSGPAGTRPGAGR